MPLSEHEQRLLDQIERGLNAEDPKFVHTVQATDPRKHYKRRMAKAAFGFVIGVCLLMAGVVSQLIPVGVIGFVVMLVSCVWGLSSWKRMTGMGGDKTPQSEPTRPTRPRPSTGRKRPRSHPSHPSRANNRGNRGSFMERMEERWRRRREEGR